MSLDFYDRDRISIAYTDDDEHLYSYCGRPVAYIHEGCIYSCAGHHPGCISDGVIRDNHGHIVLYTADSRGVCVKSYRLPAPQKGIKQMRHLKCRRRAKHEIPYRLS
ncbi:4-fold beta flower protein [Pseudomonas sp. PHC1]|uniref:4-fold beta flower protein n=1 Tax=Pseudomonas sp. PHC1 TaxID=3384759 RepID=UPI00396F2F8C